MWTFLGRRFFLKGVLDVSQKFGMYILKLSVAPAMAEMMYYFEVFCNSQCMFERDCVGECDVITHRSVDTAFFWTKKIVVQKIENVCL